MNVVLYSTNCPNCKVLERELNSAKIDYCKINDIEVMIEKGFKSAPMLEVEDITMTFPDALKWINERLHTC